MAISVREYLESLISQEILGIRKGTNKVMDVGFTLKVASIDLEDNNSLKVTFKKITNPPIPNLVLTPCINCKGTNIVDYFMPLIGKYSVYCAKCRYGCGHYDTKLEAKQAWNDELVFQLHSS